MASVIIRLQNLPMTANASNIRRFFGGLNIPEGGVHIVGGEKGDAFIAFATDEDARKAMLLDHQHINSAQIRLFLSSKAEMQSVIDTARCSVLMAAQQPSSTQETASRPGQYNPTPHTISAPPQPYPHHPTSTSSAGDSYNQPLQSRPIPSNKVSEMPMDNVHDYGHGPTENWDSLRNGNQSGYSGYIGDKNGASAHPESRRNDVFVPPSGPSEGRYGSYEGIYDGRPPPPSADGYYGYSGDYESGAPYDEASPGYYNENGPRFSGERDFSIRPPWLRDEDHHFSRRPFPPDPSAEVAPYKRHRSDEPHSQNSDLPCLDFVVKISMRPADVTVRNVFTFLRGVNIVPKFGIRLEEDALKRYTGNVYCLLTCPESHHRALACNGNVFRGSEVMVVNSSPEEYFTVTDSNFESRCPPDILEKIPSRAPSKPNYYNEGCIEISEIPSNVSEKEIVSFLGAPGLTVDNVKIIQASPRDSVVALVRLPSARDLDILLGAPPRPFSRNQTQNVRLMAISNMQFVHSVAKSTQSKLPDGASKVGSGESGSVAKTCCFIYGFSRNMTIFEISKIFPNVFIPGDAIHLLSSCRAAVIDFISESSCKTALRDFSAAEAELKKAHRSLCMRAISKTEFEQKLQETDNQTKASNNDGDIREPRPNPRYHCPPQPPPVTPPRGVVGRPPFPPPGPPPAHFRRPGPPPVVNVHISNLPPNCPPNAVLDIFRPFRPLPGSLRFRRDHRGNQMGEALISFGCFGDADRAAHETNSLRLFNKSLAVRVHQQ